MKKLFQKINDNKQLRNGIILLTFLLIVAIMAPVLATYDPFKLNDDILAHPGGNIFLVPMAWEEMFLAESCMVQEPQFSLVLSQQ